MSQIYEAIVSNGISIVGGKKMTTVSPLASALVNLVDAYARRLQGVILQLGLRLMENNCEGRWLGQI